MNVLEMTRKDFLALPHRKWDHPVVCRTVIVLPLRSLHDSGYRHMDFVATVHGEAICLLSGRSDVIHLNGIGGFGPGWDAVLPNMVIPSGWNIDCLPKSGLLQFWPSSCKILVTDALSSFAMYALPKDDKRLYTRSIDENGIPQP